jgi:SHS2 domain-containing protein
VEAARGLTATITELARVEPRSQLELTLAEPALDLLLVAFLEELLYRFDTEGVVACGGRAVVEEQAHGWELRATLDVDRYDAARHPLAVQVKAITYHGLEVTRVGGTGGEPVRWRAQVLFDI